MKKHILSGPTQVAVALIPLEHWLLQLWPTLTLWDLYIIAQEFKATADLPTIYHLLVTILTWEALHHGTDQPQTIPDLQVSYLLRGAVPLT